MFDFVISCGIHNLETGSNDEDTIRFLRKAWAAANEAVAFSMLSKTADRIVSQLLLRWPSVQQGLQFTLADAPSWFALVAHVAKHSTVTGTKLP